ncbi:uncharacterized protein A4U43_C08F21120 [Asparagus officinalis]|nr:uncharacterized protein A4U43_C08F21120 [Asparagus officinalis]
MLVMEISLQPSSTQSVRCMTMSLDLSLESKESNSEVDGIDGESSASMESSVSFNVVESIRSVDDGVDGESTTSVEIVKSMKLMLMREQRRS